jgi:prepilin-type N-terminal cleavage/methylation domain-containing protein
MNRRDFVEDSLWEASPRPMTESIAERNRRRRRVPQSIQSPGFTLMEIVLAIALMSVVMYLLATAIETFMIRIETSRGRVESAQVARTLLDRMAADLVATRLYAPPSSTGGSGQGGEAGGASGAGASGGAPGTTPPVSGSTSGAAAGGASDLLTQSDVQGIYGALDRIRIDRSAAANWERASRQIEPEEGAGSDDMPLSVQYYVVDGDRLTSQSLAQRGVPEDDRRSTNAAGLYRSTRPTASLAEGADPLGDESTNTDGNAVLLAPEVVKLELQYFDGTDLSDTWDVYDAGGLPAGVEIRLTLYEPRLELGVDDDFAERVAAGRFHENELVEYRRFVRIPSINPQQTAEALLPVAESGESGGQGGDAGEQNGENGQGGPGQNGGGNQGGGQGSGQN